MRFARDWFWGFFYLFLYRIELGWERQTTGAMRWIERRALNDTLGNLREEDEKMIFLREVAAEIAKMEDQLPSFRHATSEMVRDFIYELELKLRRRNLSEKETIKIVRRATEIGRGFLEEETQNARKHLEQIRNGLIRKGGELGISRKSAEFVFAHAERGRKWTKS